MVRRGVALTNIVRQRNLLLNALSPSHSLIGEVFVKKIPSEEAAALSSPKSQSCVELCCGTQVDQFRFPGNCPPTRPLSHHFAPSEK